MARIDCRTVPTIEPGKLYIHPNATDVGTCSDGCCDKYVCPDCNTSFIVEAPQ
jgi:hypothetical protein